MKTKKLFALLIVATFVCALPVLAAPTMETVESAEEGNISNVGCEMAALSSEVYTEGYYTYIVSNGEAIITNCDNSISGNVVIPNTLGDYPVTSIGASAFYLCEKLTSIDIPDSVTSIEKAAFKGCSSLEEISLPFVGCKRGGGDYGYDAVLGWVFGYEIHDYSVYAYTHSTFYPPEGTTIQYRDSSNKDGAGESIFLAYCYYIPESLTGVYITDDTIIPNNAFINCTNLTYIVLYESVTDIADNAYENCNDPTVIRPTVDEFISGACGDNLTYVLDRDFCLTISGTGKMWSYDHWFFPEAENVPWFPFVNKISSVIFEEGVTSIGLHSFYFCRSIKNVTLPASIASFGYDGLNETDNPFVYSKDVIIHGYEGSYAEAFAEKNSITFVPVEINENAISGTYGDNISWSLIGNALLISGSGEMNDFDAPWDTYRETIATVSMQNGITNIGAEAFFHCKNLVNIFIPDSVTGIGDYAFYNCESLEEVAISVNVTNIGANTFTGCNNITIKSYSGYYPEVYANENNIPFVSIGYVAFTVNFDANGGTTSTVKKSVYYSLTYGTLPTPTRSGYNFVGWFTELDSGTQIISNTKVELTEDQTLYARWTEALYKVSFNANGGEVEKDNISVTYNSEYGTLPEPTRYGYTFDGWFTELDGGTQVTNETICVSTANHTLYAHWTDSIFLINFDANSGVNAPDTQEKSIDVDILITNDIPTREYYTFLGWATSADATVPEYFPGDVYSANEDLTLYAVWESNFGEEIFFTDFNADTVIVRNMGTSTAPSIRFLDGVTSTLTMSDADTAFAWDNTNGYVTTNAGGVTSPVLGLNVTFADKGLYTVKFDYLASDVNVTAIKVLANASEHTVLVTTTGEWVNVVSTFMLGDNLSSVSIGAVFADAGDSTASFDNIHVYREDVTNPVTYPGASIRALDNNKLGIRFMASVMHEVWDDDNSEVGFIIARKSVLGDTELAFGCGIPTAHGAAKIGDIRRVYQDLEDGVYFTGVLRGIPDGAENEVMVGRPYMKIGDNYYYGDIIERSVLDVALAVRDNEEAYENCTEELKQAIDSMIDKHFPDNESFINPDGLFKNM